MLKCVGSFSGLKPYYRYFTLRNYFVIDNYQKPRSVFILVA